MFKYLLECKCVLWLLIFSEPIIYRQVLSLPIVCLVCSQIWNGMLEFRTLAWRIMSALTLNWAYVMDLLQLTLFCPGFCSNFSLISTSHYWVNPVCVLKSWESILQVCLCLSHNWIAANSSISVRTLLVLCSMKLWHLHRSLTKNSFIKLVGENAWCMLLMWVLGSVRMFFMQDSNGVL